MFDLETYLEERRRLINNELAARMPGGQTRPQALHEAMRYSVFSGGKRVRPILCMAAAEAVSAPHDKALVPALAVEALHTYTLIHDDLPCMDDDDMRRGKPTLHKVYGEAIALLAGDALLTLAFEWLAAAQAPSPYRPNQFSIELAQAAGSTGVIGGQVEDIAGTGSKATPDLVEYIHVHKTAALIRAAVRMGAIAAGAKEAELEALSGYGADIGLAFQIVDDILDATPAAGQNGKPTYVSVYGAEESAKKAQRLAESALETIRNLKGNVEPLNALARYVVRRTA